MKHNSKLNRSRWLLLTLFTLIVGISPAWGDNADFENALPTGWEAVGTMDYYERPKTGYYSIGNSYNQSWDTNRGNYIKTTKLEGDITLWVRSYKSGYTGYVVLFKLSDDGTTVGDKLQAFSSSSTTFEEKSYTLTEPTRLAIVINYAHLDNMTYTEYAAASGPAFVVKDGATKLSSPYAFNFGLATAGTTKTFTLTNPSTEAVEGLSVSETGSFDATLSATSIAAGGQTTLTITMPSTTGSSTITISSTTEGIDDFVINASGTLRDPNKVYLDFSDGKMPDGWTSVKVGSWAADWTVGTGYIGQSNSQSYTTTNYDAAFKSPKLTFTKDEVISFESAKYNNNANATYIKVQYSTDGSEWIDCSDNFTDNVYGTWKQRTATIPTADAKYIRFYGKNTYLRNIYGGELPLEPKLTVTEPASLSYGAITEATAKTFTITNTGRAVMTGISVTSNNPAFTITGAPSSLEPDASKEVTVTLGVGSIGVNNATITVSATDLDDVSFDLTGTVLPTGLPVVDFNDNQLPANWTNNGWTFSNGAAYLSNNDGSKYMNTPKIVVKEGDMFVVKIKTTYSGSYYDVTINGSSDNGETWTAYTKSFYPGTEYQTYLIDDIPSTVNRLQFKGHYAYIDEIQGINYAPELAVTKGGEAVTSGNTHDFGECAANANVTYSFANAGAGTINITNVAITGDGAAAYSTNWSESVATPFDLIITRTYDAERVGNQEAAITVTTSEGNFIINVQGTDMAADAPVLAVALGGDAVSDGDAVSFGTRLTAAPSAKTFTITNSGTGTLAGTIASSASDQFTVSKTSFSLGAGKSTTFDLALVFNETYGSKGADITIHPTNDGLEDIVISASAFTYDPESWIEDFAGGSLPTGWENTTWTVGTFSSYENKTAMALAPNGATAGSLITPCLTAKEGDVLTWDAYFNWYDEPMTVEYSTNKSSWTKIYDGYTANTDFGNTRYTHKEMSFTAPADGDYYLRFTSTYSNGVDNFIGFKPCAQAPILAVFSDAEATASVTSGTTKDFGWANIAQSATYYITNSGTGTLTISEISAVDGFTAATAGGVMTVAAGADPLALTITMTNAAVGAKSGIFTLTTDGGNFEIPVKGFIYGSKNMVDFTDASQYQGWTTEGWTISEGAASVSSSKTMQTTKLSVEANEKLYVEAKSNGSYFSSANLTYSYSTDNGENWTDGAAAIIASTTSSSDYAVYTLSDIADAEAVRTVLLRFTGANVAINRIYGFTALSVPVMSIDKTADYNFDMQTEAAEYVITVTNNGTATLNNLTATLATGTDYSVAITKPDGESTTTITDGKATVPAGQQAIITVTQLFDANNGLASLSDVLTISGDDVESEIINLSGKTRDGSKWYVDFASGIPASFIEKGSWNYTSQQGYAFSESALVSQTLTIAANEKIQFDAKQYSSYYASNTVLKVRHSVNGGLTWSDYTDLTGELGLDYTTLQYSVGNTDASAVAMIEFLGTYVYLDNIYGGTLNNEAPMIQVKKGSSVVESGVAEAFGTILAEASAEYTIKNIGGGTLTITSPVTVTGDATATISETSLANNESATLTITMPVEAPYGDKAGVVTVETSLGDFVINYTATTKNPSTLNVDFSDGQLPAGWYNDSWSVDYSDKNIQRSNRNSDTYFMTQKLQVTGNEDVLKFDAKKYGSQYASYTVLKVSYSTDRVNWTDIGDYASEMTTSWNTFEISGLEAGEYYLKFTGRYAAIDNIIGWEKVAGIDHDLYVTATSFPAATDKGESATITTITATVTSLRTAETGVYAKLFINGEVAQTADAQGISLNGTKTFEFNYAIPENKTAQIKVYYSDDTEAFATAVNTMKVNYTMDETSTPEAFDAGTYDVKLTYTKDAEKLGTICLPFATTTEELSEAYGTTVKIYELTGRAENVITFNGVDELTAGTPYLIYSDEDLSGEKSFEDKTVVAAAGNSEASSVTFQGIYAPTTAGNWGAEWYGVTSEGKIAKGTETTTMKGLRAYFTGNVADARIFIMDDEGTTRIATINHGGVAIDNAAVYNLNGQKVQNAKKGLYIVNGRKVVIK